MNTVQNISPFGSGPVTVPGIIDTGTLSVVGTTSLDNGNITTNGTGTVTANGIQLQPGAITLQSAVVTFTAAQVLAMTTATSTWLTVVGPTAGMWCSPIRCSITGSTTPFTGGSVSIVLLVLLEWGQQHTRGIHGSHNHQRIHCG